MKKVYVSLLALAIALPAQAGMYFGINLSRVEYDETGFESAEPTALSLRIGNEINSNLAFEGRLGFGLADDTVTVFGIPVDVEIDHFAGIYARGILPLDKVSLYGLVGYTDGKITASAGGFSVSESDSDFSYGIGADFAVSKTGAINLEWAHLFSGSAYDVTALSIGYKHNF